MNGTERSVPMKPSRAGLAMAGRLLLGFSLPAVAWAATPEEPPRFGPLLFGLAVLVGAAKAGGLLAK